MGAGVKVSGPTAWYVGTGSAGALQFLGYCEGEANIALEGEFEDVFADFGGGRVPIDSTYQGEQAYISGTFSYYDEAVMELLLKRTAHVAHTNSPGTVPHGTIGTLMISEGAAVQLVITSPYASKTVMTSQGLVPGYNFSAAWIPSSVSVGLSTSVKKPRVSFRAIPRWTTSGSPLVYGGVLYTHTIPSLPAIS